MLIPSMILFTIVSIIFIIPFAPSLTKSLAAFHAPFQSPLISAVTIFIRFSAFFSTKLMQSKMISTAAETNPLTFFAMSDTFGARVFISHMMRGFNTTSHKVFIKSMTAPNNPIKLSITGFRCCSYVSVTNFAI